MQLLVGCQNYVHTVGSSRFAGWNRVLPPHRVRCDERCSAARWVAAPAVTRGSGQRFRQGLGRAGPWRRNRLRPRLALRERSSWLRLLLATLVDAAPEQTTAPWFAPSAGACGRRRRCLRRGVWGAQTRFRL